MSHVGFNQALNNYQENLNSIVKEMEIDAIDNSIVVSKKKLNLGGSFISMVGVSSFSLWSPSLIGRPLLFI